MNLMVLAQMLFSLCCHLLINIWTFLVVVFVLILGFTDGFGFTFSFFNFQWLLVFYIWLLHSNNYRTADWFTTFVVSYCFFVVFLNISAQYNCFYLHKLGKHKKSIKKRISLVRSWRKRHLLRQPISQSWNNTSVKNI